MFRVSMEFVMCKNYFWFTNLGLQIKDIKKIFKLHLILSYTTLFNFESFEFTISLKIFFSFLTYNEELNRVWYLKSIWKIFKQSNRIQQNKIWHSIKNMMQVNNKYLFMRFAKNEKCPAKSKPEEHQLRNWADVYIDEKPEKREFS